MSSILKNSFNDFLQFLDSKQIKRFYFIFDPQKSALVASHPDLQDIADYFSADKRDFLNHEGLFFERSKAFSALHGVFIHCTNRGQGQGGVRFWTYDTADDYFRDGLRLSEGMTRKNALASLWWGGGKGIIARPKDAGEPDSATRRKLFEEYGALLTSLKGCYITAEDVGASPQDLEVVHSKTRFVSCIPPEIGGSGNPSHMTAQGVLRAMEGALEFTGRGTLEGKTIAVQGLGHVASFLMDSLFDRGVQKIIATDIFEPPIQSAKERYSKNNLETFKSEPGDMQILSTDCDILAPCATGAVLNPETIPQIKAPIICGAANNQLEDFERDGRALFERSIDYVPDFLANRMGIVNCANEQYGYVTPDPVAEQHLSKDWEHSVYSMTKKVLEQAHQTKTPPANIAVKLADELAQKTHPIFGARAAKIIQTLRQSDWASA